MNRKPTDPTKIGDLFAGNLFGISRAVPEQFPDSSQNNPELFPSVSRVITRAFPGNFPSFPRKNTNFRTETTVFGTPINTNPVKAILPYITSECFAGTMNRYRIYIANYNENIKALNEQIVQSNKEVKKRVAAGLNQVESTFRNLFIKKHEQLPAKEYNELANEFNKERGELIELKRHRTVKYATELVFQQILHIYSVQLARYTNEFMKFQIFEPSILRKVELNAHTITELERNGVKSISICKQTFRNHRAILEEAGVLVSYEFRGHKKAVKMHINSEILEVFDAKTKQNITFENQSLTPETSKEFKDNKEVTRSIKRNINKRANGKADLTELGTPSAEFSICFLQEHPIANKKDYQTEAAENVKISTNNLEKTILHPGELARKLSNGDFNNYSPIDIRFLHREAMYGTLTREEFNEVIIQDFFKTAAKYYRNHSVYIGSWKKAITEWTENRFKFSNGTGKHLCNKQLMVDKLEEYRWRLKNSQNFYRKSGVKRLFPSDYFDFSRKTKQEIGFEYTEIAWKRHLEYLQREPELKKRTKRKQEARLVRLSDTKKYDYQLKRFFNNRISYSQLYDYVKDNLPKQFLQKLSEVVLKTAEKYQC